MITEFAKTFNISELEILDRCRRREIVEIRQLYWLCLYEKAGFTYSHIGRLSGFDYATVYHGVKAFRDKLEIGDKRVKLMYDMAKEIEYPSTLALLK